MVFKHRSWYFRLNKWNICSTITVTNPTKIWNSLHQNCEAKQWICESENHYMENHSLHQKVKPSEVTTPDYEFLCFLLTRAKQEEDRGGLWHWEEGKVSVEKHKYYYHTSFMFTYLSTHWHTIYKSHILELNFRIAFGIGPSNPTYIYITKRIPNA